MTGPSTLNARDRELIGQIGRMIMLAVYKSAALIVVGVAVLLLVDPVWRPTVGFVWAGAALLWLGFRLYDLARAVRLTSRILSED